MELGWEAEGERQRISWWLSLRRHVALRKLDYNSLIPVSNLVLQCQVISGSVKNKQKKTPVNTSLYKNNSRLQHITWNDSLGKDVLKVSFSTLIQTWNTSPWGGTQEPAHIMQYLGLQACSNLVLVFLLPLPAKFWLLHRKAYQSLWC